MAQPDQSFKFCQSCGERHEAVAAFCPSCGRELDKNLSSKEHDSSSEPGGRKKSSSRPKARVLVGIALGAAVLIGGGLLFTGGGESIEAPAVETVAAPAVETVAECVVDGGYLALASRTSKQIGEMGTSLRVATTIGTREALLRAMEGLNTVHGPAFSSLAREWRAIDDCGDQRLASYNDDLASELSSIGSTFTSLEAEDTAAFGGTTRNLNNITTITTDLAAYIGTL